MTKADRAVGYLKDGFTCAQAVASSYCEELGLDTETTLRLSCGLGAGVSRLGHICGAVSGGCLLIGLHCGQSSPQTPADKESTFSAVQEFVKRFEERNGSTTCRGLLGVDMLADDPARVAERTVAVCPKAVHSAVEILEEMLF